ncbi:hypothetical protein ACIP66_10230 [Pseudomonas sp. NPDC088429]|uniref:hypothetical protein n=1 Tax=Pseudomonas sp. NPDC088429 TaxID=3364455 RepID=UPI003807DC73
MLDGISGWSIDADAYSAPRVQGATISFEGVFVQSEVFKGLSTAGKVADAQRLADSELFKALQKTQL